MTLPKRSEGKVIESVAGVFAYFFIRRKKVGPSPVGDLAIAKK